MRRSPLLACVLVLALALAAPALAGRATPTRALFIWPANGTISSPFGPRGGGFHPGIDIGMLRSLAVRGAFRGTVVATGYTTGYEGYGNIVVVDSSGDGNGGMVEIYAHLSRVAVTIGDTIEAGDPIGTAGCTGSCSGTHLHFEVRLSGKAIDPLPFLTGD